MHDKGYSNQVFIQLLRQYVDEQGNVDYARWQSSPEDVQQLDQQVAMLAEISPTNRPELFADADAIRSYWINTYNTLVLHAVLALWPLTSVRDVKISASSKLIPGKGFFYDRPVIVGGLKTNLLKLENSIIRKQLRDPRLHFALNCASGSCPALRPSDWGEDELETASCEFINNPANVAVMNSKVCLSRIFKWYKKDFPTDLYGFLLRYADEPLAGQLQTASDQHYSRTYFKYGWELNCTKPGPTGSG